MKINCLLVTVLLLIGSISVNAQIAERPWYEEDPDFDNLPPGRYFMGEIGFQLNFPRGDYKRQNNHVAFGIGGCLAFPIKGIPLYAGLDMNYNIFEFTRTYEPWNTDGFYGYYDTETFYQIASIHMLARLQPEYGPILPYLDFLVGGNFLWTRSSIDLEDYYDDDSDLSSNYVTFDASWSFGIGIGAMIKISNYGDDENSDNGLYLNGGVRAMFGTSAEYATTENKQILDDEVVYELQRSRTDMYTFRMGILFKF
ncbi:MAG: hypothetical protein ACLFQX_05435 [Candidatus Kapaibacterium sp.]